MPFTFVNPLTYCTPEELAFTNVAPGIVEVVANQSGNETYRSAPGIYRWFTVRKTKQTIQFLPPAINASAVELNAKSSAGLPVSFEVIAGHGIVIDNTLTEIGEGPITVRAIQNGNENYDKAPPGQRQLLFSGSGN